MKSFLILILLSYSKLSTCQEELKLLTVAKFLGGEAIVISKGEAPSYVSIRYTRPQGFFHYDSATYIRTFNAQENLIWHYALRTESTVVDTLALVVCDSGNKRIKMHISRRLAAMHNPGFIERVALVTEALPTYGYMQFQPDGTGSFFAELNLLADGWNLAKSFPQLIDFYKTAATVIKDVVIANEFKKYPNIILRTVKIDGTLVFEKLVDSRSLSF